MLARIAVVAALVCAIPNVVEAQTEKNPDPIRIALVTDLPHPTARAAVILKGSEKRLDLILVTNEATAADLAQAAVVLLEARNPQKAKKTKEKMEMRENKEAVDMLAFIPPARSANSPNAAFAQAELNRLKRAPARPLTGFGNVPSIVSKVLKKKPGN